MPGYNYTEGELLSGLCEADSRVDNSIKYDQFDSMDDTTPSSASSISDRFGGWNNAKEEAGLVINKSGRWDDRETSESYRYRLKESVSCENCDEEDIPALSFHHPDDVEKGFEITKQPRWPEDIKEEAEKCICLCKNCHSKHHYDGHEFNADRLQRVTAPDIKYDNSE